VKKRDKAYKIHRLEERREGGRGRDTAKMREGNGYKHIENRAVSECHHCYNVATFPSQFQTKYLLDVSYCRSKHVVYATFIQEWVCQVPHSK
jgi:hypothetical protein